MPRKFFVHTYGCQMNEHDSERIAGLLEADGLEPAASDDEADVIVLNTCCIRENADNKLYGNLGYLKSVKQTRPDLQIVVSGCLAQKDRDMVLGIPRILKNAGYFAGRIGVARPQKRTTILTRFRK